MEWTGLGPSWAAHENTSNKGKARVEGRTGCSTGQERKKEEETASFMLTVTGEPTVQGEETGTSVGK